MASRSHFRGTAQKGRPHPERKSSKDLTHRILNVVAVVAPKIPFTTSARKSAMPKLLALTYYFVLPSLFLTFAPDDVHGALNLRFSLPATSNQVFPVTDSSTISAKGVSLLTMSPFPRTLLAAYWPPDQWPLPKRSACWSTSSSMTFSA